jgi:hypothetical protein
MQHGYRRKSYVTGHFDGRMEFTVGKLSALSGNGHELTAIAVSEVNLG